MITSLLIIAGSVWLACMILGIALRCVWEMFKVSILLVLAIFVVALVGCKPVPPQPVVEVVRTKPAVHLPSKCAHLYNVGRHKEWAACMGVPYR